MRVTIRNVDPKIYKKFKAQAKKDGLTIGEAFNPAIRHYLYNRNKEKTHGFN